MRPFAVCLLLLLALPAAADYPFDRVFTTPEERRALDAYRRDGELLPEQDAASSDGTGGAEVPETEKVRFSGYLLRSDGRQTVWVDGQSTVSSSEVGNAGAIHGRVHRGEEALQFRARREARKLKPGQVWLLNEDRVMEGYELPQEAAAIEEAPDADVES